MVFKKYLFVPDNGIGICPAILVGGEGGRAIIWKIIDGIVLERVVEFTDLVKWREEWQMTWQW